MEARSFPGGKRIAVTTSWDDGAVDDRRVVDALNQWGMKGTFNLNSGKLGDENVVKPEEVAALYRGHEVAIHTVSHPNLTKLGDDEIVREVTEDRESLEGLVRYPVRGMAYPLGDFDDRVIGILQKLDISYCRSVDSVDPCFPPKQRLAWPNTVFQLAENGQAAAKWKAFYENLASRGVFAVWGHSWEFSRTAGWEFLEQLYRPMSGHADVWYCTNIELFDWWDNG